MDKSPDAFRTISEVAEHLETPAHVLRFWESRFPQIKPVKRAGGRRYYRPADVSLLTGIKRLLHDEGMTIRGVQKILREQGVRHVARLSGDQIADDVAIETDYVDQAAIVPDQPQPVPGVAVPLKPVTEPPRPEQSFVLGLADAMAKALIKAPGTKRPDAPTTALPSEEPAQGALLLTQPPEPGPDHQTASETPPQAKPDEDVPLAAAPVPDDMPATAAQDTDLDIAAYVQASRDAEATVPDPADSDTRSPSRPDPDPDLDPGLGDADEHAGDLSTPDDFDDDDFEGEPVTTLASRIRALPPEASARGVGRELLGVVARLQSLRDRVVDAAQSDRG